MECPQCGGEMQEEQNQTPEAIAAAIEARGGNPAHAERVMKRIQHKAAERGALLRCTVCGYWMREKDAA